MNKLFILKIIILLSVVNLNANDFDEYLKIKSDKVEFLNESNNVNFSQNVFIDSNYVKISASSAVYDEENQIFSIFGEPTIIKSIKNEKKFHGVAEKILFFDDSKVHLIGNASMKLENISISSNLIVFNSITGKISSN